MLKSQWLNAFAGRLQACQRQLSGRRRYSSRKNPQPVIAVECLEDRSLLTVLAMAGSALSIIENDTLSSFPIPDGSDRVLVVAVSDTDSTDIVSVAFGGVDLTEAVELTGGGDVGSIWYLVLGSDAGLDAGDIVVTTSGADLTPTFIGAVVLSGVDQIAPLGDIQSVADTTDATASSLTVLSTVGDLVFDLFDSYDDTPHDPDAPTQDPGPDQILIVNNELSEDFKHSYSTSTQAVVAPNTDVTMTWDWVGGRSIQVAANFLQAAPIVSTNLVNLTAGLAAGDETGETDITLTATADTPVVGDQTVDIAATGVSATDYLLSGMTITILDGETEGSVTFKVLDDNLVEALTEMATLTISNPSSGISLGATFDQVIEITDNDSATISLSAASAFESAPSKFTVTLSKAVDTDVTVRFSTLTLAAGTGIAKPGVTATGTADFAKVTNYLVTFPANSTTAQVVGVLVNDDVTVEPSEIIKGQISTLVAVDRAVTLSGTSATGTILDNDGTPSVTVTVAPVTSVGVLEDGTANLIYTFTRGAGSSKAFTAAFTVTGTAVFGSDYTQTGAATFATVSGVTKGTVKFLAGQATATVTLDPRADRSLENHETAILTLNTGTGYTLGAAKVATGTILDDDTPVVTVAVSADVLEDGTENLIYTFTRSLTQPDPLTINFLVDNTSLYHATYLTDYTQTGAQTFTTTTGKLAFGFGQATAIITINPMSDSDVEPDEHVKLTVTSGTNYRVGTSPNNYATAKILKDDFVPVVTVSVSTDLDPDGDFVDEDGTHELVFTFTRSSTNPSLLTVSFTVSGDAVFVNDYRQTGASTFGALKGTVTFGFGQFNATVRLRAVNDILNEDTESVMLSLFADPLKYSFDPLDSSATGYIGD